jgi:hypothetical protein
VLARTLARQRPGQRRRAVGKAVAGGLDDRKVTPLQVGDALAREPLDCLRAGHLGEEPQRGGREVVVAVVMGRVTRVGQPEHPRRTTSPARAATAPPALRGDRRQQRVEVPAHRGRVQPQALGERPGGGRTGLEDRAGDPVAGAEVGRGLGGRAVSGGRASRAAVEAAPRCRTFFTTPV